MKDQIELLTHTDAHRLIDTLPVRHPTSTNAIRKSISQEPEDPPPPGESPSIQAFLTGLSWATYAFAVVAVVFLTWSAADLFK